MSHQLTFADSEFSTKRRQTRKEIFLSRMEHILPWQNMLHAGEENLFSGLTALSAEFTIGEGELMAHDVPLGCAPDEYDDLISGTCSHLPLNSDMTLFLRFKITRQSILFIQAKNSPCVIPLRPSFWG